MVADAAEGLAERTCILLGNSVEQQRANDLDMARERLQELVSASGGEGNQRGSFVIWRRRTIDEACFGEGGDLVGEPAAAHGDAVRQVGHSELLARSAHQPSEDLELHEAHSSDLTQVELEAETQLPSDIHQRDIRVDLLVGKTIRKAYHASSVGPA